MIWLILGPVLGLAIALAVALRPPAPRTNTLPSPPAGDQGTPP